ncbi:hypothetical protein WMY93_007331 [Mugilogobius chulae]|uniref:Uncharacterized protein n=1 Tax=Mugilogobius chulae TaxID=88201 RepID=A0AAW0PCX1_9GOBI
MAQLSKEQPSTSQYTTARGVESSTTQLTQDHIEGSVPLPPDKAWTHHRERLRIVRGAGGRLSEEQEEATGEEREEASGEEREEASGEGEVWSCSETGLWVKQTSHDLSSFSAGGNNEQDYTDGRTCLILEKTNVQLSDSTMVHVVECDDVVSPDE